MMAAVRGEAIARLTMPRAEYSEWGRLLSKALAGAAEAHQENDALRKRWVQLHSRESVLCP
jgi:hypothetical protein